MAAAVARERRAPSRPAEARPREETVREAALRGPCWAPEPDELPAAGPALWRPESPVCPAGPARRGAGRAGVPRLPPPRARPSGRETGGGGGKERGGKVGGPLPPPRLCCGAALAEPPALPGAAVPPPAPARCAAEGAAFPAAVPPFESCPAPGDGGGGDRPRGRGVRPGRRSASPGPPAPVLRGSEGARPTRGKGPSCAAPSAQ